MFTKPKNLTALEAHLNGGVSRPVMVSAAAQEMVRAVTETRIRQLRERAEETAIINAALAKKDKI